MLRLGVRGHDMGKVPFEELVKNIAGKGFCCTQLALKKSITEFNVNLETMTPGMALYMKRIFDQNKVDVAVLGCYQNLANPDPIQLKEITKAYEAHIRFASLLGCGMVGTETGAVNKEYRYEEANHSEEALSIFIRNLKPVVEYAQKMGVIIGIEPVYKHIMCDIKRTRKVLDAIASPNLRVILDPINLLNAENYIHQDEIMQEAFEVLKDEISALHIKDFVIMDGEVKSQNLAVGDGLFHLDVLMKLAKEHKPFIHMLIEDSKPENVFQSKEMIEKVYHEQ